MSKPSARRSSRSRESPGQGAEGAVETEGRREVGGGRDRLDRPFRKFPRWRARPGRPALTLAVTRGAILSTSARAPGGGPPCRRPPQGRVASPTGRSAFGANPEDPENTRILSAAGSPVAPG